MKIPIYIDSQSRRSGAFGVLGHSSMSVLLHISQAGGSTSCQGAEDGIEYYTWRVAAPQHFASSSDARISRRWADASKFASDWDERSRLIAGMIPAGSRVLDIGAGR